MKHADCPSCGGLYRTEVGKGLGSTVTYRCSSCSQLYTEEKTDNRAIAFEAWFQKTCTERRRQDRPAPSRATARAAWAAGVRWTKRRQKREREAEKSEAREQDRRITDALCRIREAWQGIVAERETVKAHYASIARAADRQKQLEIEEHKVRRWLESHGLRFPACPNCFGPGDAISSPTLPTEDQNLVNYCCLSCGHHFAEYVSGGDFCSST